MASHKALRLAVVVGVAFAAHAGMWLVLRPIEPHLDVVVRREARTERYDLWTVRVTVRGGEILDEVGVEPVSGPVHVITLPKNAVGSGQIAEFRVQLDDGRNSTGVVRIVQIGRVSRSYVTPLVEAF